MGITREISTHIAETGYERLPAEVVDCTKRIILDAIICGLAAADFERSRMMHGVVSELGGPEEASVFGMTRRVPAAHAAMANAEIMNLLDADDTFFTSSHFAVFNVAGALARAQQVGASGRDVILGTALGFDVNARLNLAQLVMSERDDGSFQWSPVQGMGFAAMGTAVSAAVMDDLDPAGVENLLGLAAWTAPTPTWNTIPERSRHLSFKYANYPGAAQAGMMALAFGRQGYVGQEAVLDGERFLRAQGSAAVDPERLTEELGEKWWILETSIKPYPSCRYTHGPIDMLKGLMTEEGLRPTDIERIEVRMHPMAYALRIFREPPREIALDHRAPLDGAFNIPYVLAVAALGRRPGPDWYSPKNLTDPEVWDFARRVETVEDESARDEVVRAFRESPIRRFRKTPSAIRVVADGREIDRRSDYATGDPWSDATHADWDAVHRKFRSFCAGLSSDGEIDRITERVRGLERLDRVDELF